MDGNTNEYFWLDNANINNHVPIHYHIEQVSLRQEGADRARVQRASKQSASKLEI